ncbi:glutamine synthetase [Actinophytocola xinjiangensis]|uniref:Glutamine synthetase n=1 Tax=Actinophytocola xinjiangensis TaxID=485602 RepID=A0A7Z1B105_9PSEU|nr:glutamine synthetase [Actinophytocola xinjiangensis]OLF12860.1 glutamine synthetase [Actinophytocola xinjiangensis]
MITNRRPRGPRTLADRAATAADLADALRSEVDSGAVRSLVLLVPDPHARFASVELGARFFVDTVLAGGYGVCSYVFAWNPAREAVSAEVFAPYTATYGDLLMRPDLATLTPLPGEPGTWLVVCDVEWPGGEPVPIAPRTALRGQLAAVEELGLVPSVGIEHEVTFTDAAGEPLVTDGLDYATLDRLRPLLNAVGSEVDEAGLDVESRRGECHPGQYESVLGHRDALAACDDAMLQQLLIRRAATARGVRAGYLAAETAGAGSSCHVHLSLSRRDGSPADLDRFVAGVLAAAADLTAIWAPTWNSYVRLRTAPFAPRDLRVGVDDRTAALRLAGTGANRRVEVRLAGADAPPHLVVAALLAAGRHGPTGTPPGRLHDTPWAARAALHGSALARTLLGDAMVDARVALLDEEIAAGLDTVTDWQRHRGDLRA